MVELTEEEEVFVRKPGTSGYQSKSGKSYAEQQQALSQRKPSAQQRPVAPPKAPPMKSAGAVRNGSVPQRQNAAQRTPQQRTSAPSRTPQRSKQGGSSVKQSPPAYRRDVAPAKKPETAKEVDKRKKESDRTSVIIKVLTSLVIVVAVFVSMYALVIFGNVPFITKWRNIWIETAMTTDQHKWLATSFFPEYLIKEVMDAQVDIKDIGHTDIKKEDEESDILGQKDLVVGEKDKHGNEVLINDIEEGIVVLKVVTSNYVGRLVLIDDPSRVYISATDYKNSRGEFICDYLEKEDAVIASNASGFHDPGGTSVGGVVTAQCVSQGEYWGTYSSKYITVGFDENDRLIVGEFSDWEERGLRDAFQYHPALIINGDKVIEGSSGWGLQPRTVIGQAENGVVMIFVVDGRQVGYSLGATMGDCADVLEMYGAVNAGACDGGSSSTLAYEGEIINEPSTNMPTGRYLPNAWVVARKSTEKSE